MFEAPKLTNAGKALYYRNLGGEALKITTMQLGDGQLSTPIATLTGLVHSVVSIDAAVKQCTDYVEVNAKFSNAGLSAGFYWREVGIFCADPDDPNDRSKDILYCYQNAYDTADYIAPAATELVEKSVTIPIIVGDATNVTCTLDKSLIYATWKDLQEHDGSEDAHPFIQANLNEVYSMLVNGEVWTALGTSAGERLCTSDGIVLLANRKLQLI